MKNNYYSLINNIINKIFDSSQKKVYRNILIKVIKSKLIKYIMTWLYWVIQENQDILILYMTEVQVFNIQCACTVFLVSFMAINDWYAYQEKMYWYEYYCTVYYGRDHNYHYKWHHTTELMEPKHSRWMSTRLAIVTALSLIWIWT